jgi:indolepyruvate ferredoxin oxidoreductase
MILLGAAFQHGCLPVPAPAIEAAVELNGVTPADNVRAFRWGRAAAADLAAVRDALAPRSAPPEPPKDLAELVEARATDLIAYQGRRYAAVFRDAVEHVDAVERARTSATDAPIARAFANGLYKLMAYKDEYEVARLHLDQLEQARLADQFGTKARTRVLLHPPLLRSLGLKHKIGLGRTARPAFRVLRWARWLRASPLDPFGRSEVRRLERRLPPEYRTMMESALDHLDDDSVPAVVALAELPDLVRGYESVKLANVEHYRARAEELKAELVHAPG